MLISEDQVVALGERSHKALERQWGGDSDPRWQDYVQGVGKRLAAGSYRPEFAYEFNVIDQSALCAFCTARPLHLPRVQAALSYFECEALRIPQRRGGGRRRLA